MPVLGEAGVPFSLRDMASAYFLISRLGFVFFTISSVLPSCAFYKAKTTGAGKRATAPLGHERRLSRRTAGRDVGGLRHGVQIPPSRWRRLEKWALRFVPEDS